jgi:hypothetical protein
LDEVDPVARLSAIEDIKIVKARYFRFLDAQDWDALLDVFTEDLTATTGAAQVITSRQEFVDLLRGNLGGGRSVHHGHMPEIEVTSSTTATGVWSLTDWVVWNPDGVMPYSAPGRSEPISTYLGYARYWETYRKVDGSWRIATLRIERLRIEPLA